MSKLYKPPSQIIQPYYFGDDTRKSTCLWLKNLPPLYHNKTPNLFDQKVTHVKPKLVEYASKKSKSGKSTYSGGAAIWFKNAEERSRYRSKTFPGVAEAMAFQWGQYLQSIYCR